MRLGLAVLFIAHDLSVVRYLCQRVVVMYRGRLVEAAAAKALFDGPQHPYTQMLLDAAPRIDRFDRDFNEDAPTEESPSPIDRPSGCPFHTRCTQAVASCSSVVPGRHAVGDGFHRCDVKAG